MALRTFTDRDGKRWNAWSVIPNGGGVLSERFRDGWVCFEQVGGGGRSRIPLADMPDDWEALTDERLELVRKVAAEAEPTGQASRIIAERADS